MSGGMDDSLDAAHGPLDRIRVADVAALDFDVEAGQGARIGRCPHENADAVSAGHKQPSDVIPHQTGGAGHQVAHRST